MRILVQFCHIIVRMATTFYRLTVATLIIFSEIVIDRLWTARIVCGSIFGEYLKAFGKGVITFRSRHLNSDKFNCHWNAFSLQLLRINRIKYITQTITPCTSRSDNI